MASGERISTDDDHNTSAEIAIEESLKCAICLEIIHKCVTIHPCMHSFCASCLSKWYQTSIRCPNCNCDSVAATKNHLTDNVIEAWLKMHPHKRRSDLDDLDEIGNYRSFSTPSRTVFIPEPVINPEPVITPNLSICRQCPGRIIPGDNEPGFVCNTSTFHVSCSCCAEYMPDRRGELYNTPESPQQSCACCMKVYCGAYWECSNHSNPNESCLKKLKDQIPTDCSRILLRNPVETEILKNYLIRDDNDQSSWPKVLAEKMFEWIDNEKFKPSPILSETTSNPRELYVCFICAKKNLEKFAFVFRSSIPENVIGTGKPNCYWGRNCWSQATNRQHAERYNHICQQIKFNR